MIKSRSRAGGEARGGAAGVIPPKRWEKGENRNNYVYGWIPPPKAKARKKRRSRRRATRWLACKRKAAARFGSRRDDVVADAFNVRTLTSTGVNDILVGHDDVILAPYQESWTVTSSATRKHAEMMCQGSSLQNTQSNAPGLGACLTMLFRPSNMGSRTRRRNI